MDPLSTFDPNKAENLEDVSRASYHGRRISTTRIRSCMLANRRATTDGEAVRRQRLDKAERIRITYKP